MKNPLNHIPSLVLSDPEHRHGLAKRYIQKDIRNILDVGGFSEYLVNDKWVKDLDGPAKVWGVVDKNSEEAKQRIAYTSINAIGEDYRKDRKPHIWYDGKKIPFDDNSFDLVTSIDTFEHIKPVNRKSVIKEMLRVARKQVILVFPFDSPDNNRFEDEITRYMQSINLEIKPSFQQHRLYGLPQVEDLLAIINSSHNYYEVSYGTDRKLFEGYMRLQVEINKLLNSPPFSEVVIRSSLKQLEMVVTDLLNKNDNLEKEDAYRVVIDIKKELR